MFMTKKLGLLGLLAGVVLCGCSAEADDAKGAAKSLTNTPSVTATTPTQNLSESDDGKTITLKAGTDLVISLESNPSTGCSWSVPNVQGKAVKQQGKSTYIGNPNPPNAKGQFKVGVGGVESFRFSTTAAGTSTIEMGYGQPWNKSGPFKKFKVTIKVVP